jgi:hypothetical protein
MKRIALASLALALAACAPRAPNPEACALGAEERVIAQMYFGRNIGAELGVSEEEWDAFVDAEVAPRLSDGFTVTDAQGQWRDRTTGVTMSEPSKQLTVFLADEAEGRLALDAIAEAYKRQFQQQAVALVVERSCVSFE